MSAFDQLMKGSKGLKRGGAKSGANPSKRKKDTHIPTRGTGGRFVHCPICNRGILPHLLDRHLESCGIDVGGEKGELPPTQARVSLELGSPGDGVIDSRLPRLLKRMETELPGALLELQFNGRKQGQYAWWVWPTEKEGRSEPRPSTAVTRVTAPELLRSAPPVWREVLEKFCSLIDGNGGSMEGVIPRIDWGRIEHFVPFFEAVPGTPAWLNGRVIPCFKGAISRTKNESKKGGGGGGANGGGLTKAKTKKDGDGDGGGGAGSASPVSSPPKPSVTTIECNSSTEQPSCNSLRSPSSSSSFDVIMKTRQSPFNRTFSLCDDLSSASWSKGKPSSGQVVACEVVIGGCKVFLTMPPTFSHLPLFVVPGGDSCSLSPPVLKSILQKAVRRRSPRSAVAAATELLLKDPNALLRRLPIVAIEDVGIVSKSFSFLVWIMVAWTKIGAEGLKKFLGGWEKKLLDIVAAMAGTSVRCVKHRGAEEDEGKEEEMELKDATDPVVACVLIRKSYGGMKGDVEMMRRFAVLERKRRDDVCQSARLCDGIEKRFGIGVGGWEEGSEVVWANASKVKMGPIRMTRGNVCEVGVDFHVSNIVEDVVNGGDDEISKVKGWMWEFESGVNLKRILDGGDGDEGGVEEEKKEYENLWKERMGKWRREYLGRRLLLR